MNISSLTLTGPTSARATEPAQPAKTPPGKTSTVIHRGITRSRERLVGTVTALVHKVRRPARREDPVRQTKETLRAKVEHGKQHLQRGGKKAQGKASAVTRKANKLTHHALAKVPAPMVGRIGQLRATVGHRPVPAVAVVLGVAWVLGLFLRRNR